MRPLFHLFITYASLTFLIIGLVSPVLGQDSEKKFLADKKKAQAGNAQAQFSLAQSFELGLGVKTSPKEALRWYRKAAKQGLPSAEYKVGRVYYRGRLGVAKNTTTAHVWILAAAEHGYTAAQTLVAKMYALGHGVPKSKKKANYWRKKSFSSKAAELEEEIAALTQASEGRKQAASKQKKEAAAKKKLAAQRKKEEQSAQGKEKEALEKRKKEEEKRLADAKARGFSDARSAKDLVLDSEWVGKKQVLYLPSTATVCDDTKKGLVCSSEAQRGERGGTKFRYKVKSIIRDFTDKGTFHVRYRNRVTKVEDSEQGTAVPMKTGWQKKTHELDCKIKSRNKISCVKDGRFKREFTRR